MGTRRAVGPGVGKTTEKGRLTDFTEIIIGKKKKIIISLRITSRTDLESLLDRAVCSAYD